MAIERTRILLAKKEDEPKSIECPKCKALVPSKGSGGVWVLGEHKKPGGGRCNKSGSSITD